MQWRVSRGGKSYCTTPDYWRQLCDANCLLEPHELQKAIPFYFPLQYLDMALTEAREVYLGAADGDIMVQDIAKVILAEEGLLRQCFPSNVPDNISLQSPQGTLPE